LSERLLEELIGAYPVDAEFVGRTLLYACVQHMATCRHKQLKKFVNANQMPG
jgi:hypothetical protein